MKAEKTEIETSVLRKNINVFKRKLKDIIESQLEIVEDIEKLNYKTYDEDDSYEYFKRTYGWCE